MAVVYSIKNKVTGKEYVGKSVNVYSRWSEHKNNCIKGVQHPLYDSTRKHRIHQFEFSIVEEVSEDLVDRREVEVVIIRQTMYPLGYNLAEGGTGGNTRKYMSKRQIESYNQKAI